MAVTTPAQARFGVLAVLAALSHTRLRDEVLPALQAAANPEVLALLELAAHGDGDALKVFFAWCDDPDRPADGPRLQ